MDIQQLLGNASHQGSTSPPSSGSGRPGIFAQHMALASLRPDAEPPTVGQDEGPRGVFGGITGHPFGGPTAADESATRFGALWREAWGGDLGADATGPAALITEIEELLAGQLSAEESEQRVAQLASQLPAAELEALLARLSEQLTAEDSAQLFTQLEAQLPADEREVLVAQLTEQLPPEESERFFAQLAEQLPADEREAFLAQLNEELSREDSAKLFAQFATQLPTTEREALLNTLSGRLTPEERSALLADLSQRLLSPQRLETISQTANLPGTAAQTQASAAASQTLWSAQSSGAQSSAAQPGAEQAARVALSEPVSLRDQLRAERRPGLASLQDNPRATVSTESSRAGVEAYSTAQSTREPFAPSLRELLGLNLASRDGFVPQQGRGPGGGEANTPGIVIASSGLSTYGAIAGGQGGGSPSSAPGLSAPLQSAAWPQQLGQQLMVLSQRGGDQRVELRLNPPDLGPLTVSLKVGEQGTQIQFLAANALVRGAVEQAIPQLREALAEQGISLGETSVGEQRQEEGQGFAEGDAQHQGRSGEALAGLGDSGFAESPANTEVWLDGRVDLYA